MNVEALFENSKSKACDTILAKMDIDRRHLKVYTFTKYQGVIEELSSSLED